MVAERLTPESVAAEAVAFDAQERIVVGGQAVMGFGELAAMTAMFSPREWEEVAAYVLALVEREPVKTSPAYLPHRTILAHLGHELRGYARIAGEPVGLEADLRAATSQAEEQRIRQRMYDDQLARERFHDDLLLADAAQRATSQPSDPEGEPIDPEPDAAPATETDVDLAYL